MHLQPLIYTASPALGFPCCLLKHAHIMHDDQAQEPGLTGLSEACSTSSCEHRSLGCVRAYLRGLDTDKGDLEKFEARNLGRPLASVYMTACDNIQAMDRWPRAYVGPIAAQSM